MERSAASAFEGHDVPLDLPTDASPAKNGTPHLDAGTLWAVEVETCVVAFLAAPAAVRQALIYEAARGLRDPCAMRLEL